MVFEYIYAKSTSYPRCHLTNIQERRDIFTMCMWAMGLLLVMATLPKVTAKCPPLRPFPSGATCVTWIPFGGGRGGEVPGAD
jgi:hypothetical protein